MKVNSATLVTMLQRDFDIKDEFLTSDMPIKKARALWLQNSLVKKFQSENSDDARRGAAVELWLRMNKRCSASFTPPDGSSYYDDVLETARDLMYQQLNRWDGYVLTLNASLQAAKHGPGKSAGAKENDFYSKAFYGDMGVSDISLHHHYVSSLSPRWLSAERERQRWWKVETCCSSLFTVPKDEKIDRVALKEPSLNMFYQLGAGKVLEGVLSKHHRIRLDRQPSVNRSLARLGSIDQTYGTIDLKSASDTIAHDLVAWLIDPLNRGTLEFLRSKVTTVTTGVGADMRTENVVLHMFSSMGNGFTFPLQTLIFATLIKALYIHLGIPLWDHDRCIPTYSVFGDDIVVVKKAYDATISLLERCGFIVNSAKSYGVGPFRESCGQDFFLGENIRGVYIKGVKTDADAYSAFNRLCRWSVRSGIAIPNLLRYVKGLADFRPVPFDVADTGGHHWPYQLTTSRKMDKHTGAVYYWRLLAKPSERWVRVDRNPDGALISFVGGYLSCVSGDSSSRKKRGLRPVKYRVGLPTDKPAYFVVRESTSSWDWIPHPGVTLRDYLYTVIAL